MHEPTNMQDQEDIHQQADAISHTSEDFQPKPKKKKPPTTPPKPKAKAKAKPKPKTTPKQSAPEPLPITITNGTTTLELKPGQRLVQKTRQHFGLANNDFKLRNVETNVCVWARDAPSSAGLQYELVDKVCACSLWGQEHCSLLIACACLE